MASQSFDRHAPAGGGSVFRHGSSPTFNRSYLMAATRAAVIALCLLAALALIVLL